MSIAVPTVTINVQPFGMQGVGAERRRPVGYWTVFQAQIGDGSGGGILFTFAPTNDNSAKYVWSVEAAAFWQGDNTGARFAAVLLFPQDEPQPLGIAKSWGNRMDVEVNTSNIYGQSYRSKSFNRESFPPFFRPKADVGVWSLLAEIDNVAGKTSRFSAFGWVWDPNAIIQEMGPVPPA